MQKFRLLLYPFSLIYNLITIFRNVFYRYGIFSTHESGTPLICIGNLSTGGTGKTPHTEMCVRMLEGNKIAVLSRGYKRKTKGYLLADNHTKAEEIGDEPFLMKRKFPQVDVVVDEERRRAIKNLVSDVRPDFIVLDDAFQHRKIQPNLNILLTDYHHPFYDDFVLPAGNLRENRFGAQRADIVIVTKCPEVLRPNQKKDIFDNIRSYTEAKVLFSTISYDNLTGVFSQEILEKNQQFEHCIALTGIAKSDLFVKKVRNICEQVQHHKYADHYDFQEIDIKELISYFEQINQQNKAIICTEKDAIRLLKFEHLLKNIPIFYWPIEIALNEKDTQYLKDKLLALPENIR